MVKFRCDSPEGAGVEYADCLGFSVPVLTVNTVPPAGEADAEEVWGLLARTDENGLDSSVPPIVFP